MSLAKKLQVQPDQQVRVVGKPKDVVLDDVPTTRSAKAGAVIVFVRTEADLEKLGDEAYAVAREDGLAWIAYPKAGKLDTDLNRDILWKLVEAHGLKPVRQVAIDDTWSALRFRPG